MTDQLEKIKYQVAMHPLPGDPYGVVCDVHIPDEMTPYDIVQYLIKRLELAEAALNEWASETFPGHALCKRGTCDYCDSYPAYLTWREAVQ